MTDRTKHSLPLIMGTALTVVGIAALAAAFVLYGKGGATPAAVPAFEAEATALRVEREKLLAESGQMEKRIKQLLAELATEKEKLASAEEFMAVQRNANEPLRQELVRFKGLYEQILPDIIRLEDAKKEAEKAREESETKLAQLQATGQAVSMKAADLEKKVAAAKELVENTSKALALREEEKSELEAKARQLEVALEASRQENAKLTASETTFRESAAKHESEAETLRAKVTDLAAHVASLTVRCAELEKELAESRAVTEGEGEQ